MWRYILRVLVLASAINCFSQEAKPLRYISLGLGVNHSSLQDKVFSPLVYRDSGFAFDVGYTCQTAKRSHRILSGLTSQELTPKLNAQSRSSVENTAIYLDYEYLRSASVKNKSHAVGAGLYNFISARNFVFLVEDEISLDFYISFNILYAYQLVLKDKHHLLFKVSYPLVAFVVGRMRVPNDFSEEVFQEIVEDPNSQPIGKILKSGDFLTINRFGDLRFRVDYLLEISKRFGIGATYSFQYYSYPKFRQVKNGASQYIARIAYKF